MEFSQENIDEVKFPNLERNIAQMLISQDELMQAMQEFMVGMYKYRKTPQLEAENEESQPNPTMSSN